MATAVFPVCRSPIINSLCPLPIGIIASTALRPVCRGSRTILLDKTPVAFLSIGEKCFASMVPFPSTGCPSGFITLPKNSFPIPTWTN